MYNVASPCKVMEDLPSCLNAPSHCVPTVEYRLLNFQLPIDAAEFAFFDSDQVNLFVDNPLAVNNDQSVVSSNLSPMTLSINGAFVMMGICIYAYGEPFAFALDGNNFGSQENIVGLANQPGSPTLLRTDAAYLTRLGLPVGVTDFQYQAQLEWGSSVWKAIWAFLNAYRIRVLCPDTNTGEYLLDELVADIGNCCSHALPEGFGTSETNWIEYVRSLNERLWAIRTGKNGLPQGTKYSIPGLGGTDPGFFFPFTVEQGFDATGEPAGSASPVTPYRQTVEMSAFGREYMAPTIEQWYRFACPIPMEKDTKIRIYLYKYNGGTTYIERMLTEMCAQIGISFIPNASATQILLHESTEEPIVATHESALWTKFPGGKLRIGIGLKGFFVRPKVCAELTTLITEGLVQYGPNGEVIAAATCGSCG